uniref:Uncharacterized protein n=1 Tax=Populus alba TaxID=43335 RepID=A0A4U5PMM6_POPAL|nr:hypothetical protein D5086_0000206070 [Populus alba]
MKPRGTANEAKINQQREKNGKRQNLKLTEGSNSLVYICIHRAPNDLSQQISGLKKLRDSFPPSTECTIRSEGDDHRATLEQPEGWHKSLVFHHREYGMDAASGAQILFLYSAAGNFMPIIGAFLADTYVGRYPMIGFGCIASLLGMVLLWLTTIFLGQRCLLAPNLVADALNDATTPQLLFLYFCFGLMSIGAGGIRSCSLAFVYIQDAMGWKVGFGVPVVLMILSTLSFLLGFFPFMSSPKAKASWLIGFARVLVASFRKRRIELSSPDTDELYHHRKGSALVVPSEK